MATISNLNQVPQARHSGFSSRLQLNQTSLIISAEPVSRATKRASTAINYAEIDDDIFEDDDDDAVKPAIEQRVEKKQEQKKLVLKKTQHPNLSQAQLQELAEDEEVLVPIKINLDITPKQRLSDFFMWNLNERHLDPDTFATMMCADLDLPVGYTYNIANAIRSQVADYKELARYKFDSDTSIKVVIDLSVNLDKEVYEDRFEWDLASDELTPEEFAKTVVRDMGIAGEFYPAIAHGIHEQILKLKREAFEGHLAEFKNLSTGLGFEAGWRYDSDGLCDDWAPTLEKLSQEEIEKREIERDRNSRRMKRDSMRMTDPDQQSRKKSRARYRYDGSPSRSGTPYF